MRLSLVTPRIREELSCYADVDGMIYPCAILWNKFPGKSFMDVGVDQAWDNLKEKPCHSCGFIGEIELNLLFTLRSLRIRNPDEDREFIGLSKHVV